MSFYVLYYKDSFGIIVVTYNNDNIVSCNEIIYRFLDIIFEYFSCNLIQQIFFEFNATEWPKIYISCQLHEFEYLFCIQKRKLTSAYHWKSSSVFNENVNIIKIFDWNIVNEKCLLIKTEAFST